MRASHGLIQAAVKCERNYQDAKWGTPDEHPHDVGAWLLIMRNELREAEDAWCNGGGDEGALCEVMQVVAVGFACLEQHGVVTREMLAELKGES